MKKVILWVMFLVSPILLQSNDDILDLTLKDYVSMVSSQLGMTIVISDEINEDFSLILPNDLTDTTYLSIMAEILRKNKYEIKPYQDYFIISKEIETIDQEKKLQFLKLNYIDFETVEPLFKTNEDYKVNYVASDKTIVFISTEKEFKRIQLLINRFDKLPNQLKLKVSIIDTNVNKLREFGSNLKTTFTDSSNFYFNLLAYPFEIKSELTNIQSNNLTSYFKFLNQNDISNLISSPTITIFDNVPTSISAVKNIPVKSGTTTQKDNTTTSTETISYRDVGLVLNINPKIYENFAYLDMEIINETLTTTSDTPTTAKNTIRQRIMLLKNKTYVLTGINQKQNFKSISRVPLLSDLPLVDWLFKIEENEDVDSNLTIILELVNDEYIETKNNIDISIFKKESKNELTEHQKRVNKILGVK